MNEIHSTSYAQILLNLWNKYSGWIAGFLAGLCIMLLQGYIAIQDEARGLSQQVNAYKTRGCPDNLHGKPFRFSANESINLSWPGYESLVCLYKKEQK